MASREGRCELIREGMVVLGSGALLLGGILVTNGALDRLQPLAQLLPGVVGAVGEALPDAISSVAGNWLSNPTYDRFARLCARFAGNPAEQPVLRAALDRAYAAALEGIAGDLDARAREEGWSAGNRRTISRVVRAFRDDVTWLWWNLPPDPGLAAPVTRQAATMRALVEQITSPEQSLLQREWRERFGEYLAAIEGVEIQPGVHDRYLVSYISHALPMRLTTCFIHELQTDREAFQTFSYLLETSNRETLEELRAGQGAIFEGLAKLEQRLRELARGEGNSQGLLDQIETLLEGEQAALALRLERVLREELSGVRDELRSVGEKVDALGTKIDEALTHIAPPVRLLPTAALGPRYKIFGREREIAKALAGLRLGQIVVVRGMTGVGKTALAVEVTYQLREEHDGKVGIILLRDQGAIDLAGLCDAIALHCNDTTIRELAQVEQKAEATKRLLASYLLTQEDRPVILVIDNLAARWVADDFLSRVRPVGLPTLITTQDKEVGLGADNVVRLHELTPEESPGEAMALVRDRAELASGDDKAIDAIAGLLGYHPLAMVIAAGQIAVQGVTPGRLARRLVSAEARLKLGEGRDRERSVRVALQVAWEALPTSAQHTLTRLAICAGPTTEPFLALVAEQDEEECAAQVGELVRRSLAERIVDERGVERVGLHQLVRDFGQQMPGIGRDGAELTLLKASDSYVSRYASNRPEAYDGIEAEATNLAAAVDLAKERAAWPVLLRIADGLISFNGLQTRGYWNMAIQIGRAGIIAAAAQGDVTTQARLAHNTAITIQDQGDLPEARRLYQESLAIKRLLGNQYGVALALHQLGNLAYQQGDYLEARRLYNETRATFVSLRDQRGVAATMHQLGMIAQDQGDYPEANRLYQESLTIKRHLGDQNGVSQTLHQLGMIAQDQGDYMEARRLHLESLAIERHLGNQRGIAQTLHELGNLTLWQGNALEAQQLYEEERAISDRLGDQIGVAKALHQLGMIAQEQRDYPEALRLYHQSLAIEQNLGNQESIAVTLHQIGTLAQDQKNYSEAKQLYSEAQTIFNRLGNQAGVAETLNQLGALARDQQDYPEARRLYQKSLGIKRHLGNQESIAISLSGMGSLERKTGNIMEARRLIEQALEIFQRLGSPHVAWAEKQLAQMTDARPRE